MPIKATTVREDGSNGSQSEPSSIPPPRNVEEAVRRCQEIRSRYEAAVRKTPARIFWRAFFTLIACIEPQPALLHEAWLLTAIEYTKEYRPSDSVTGMAEESARMERYLGRAKGLRLRRFMLLGLEASPDEANEDRAPAGGAQE